MDDLIGRLVADSGADRTAAHSAIGIVAQSPSENAPFQKVRTAMPELLPGAKTASPTAGSRSAQAIICKLLKFSREPEENAVGDLVGAIPRFGQSV